LGGPLAVPTAPIENNQGIEKTGKFTTKVTSSDIAGPILSDIRLN